MGIPYDLEVYAEEMVSSSSGRLLQERRYMQCTKVVRHVGLGLDGSLTREMPRSLAELSQQAGAASFLANFRRPSFASVGL